MKKRPEEAGIITILVTVIRCLATWEVVISGWLELLIPRRKPEDGEGKHLTELRQTRGK
jgi:hypothetical protein